MEGRKESCIYKQEWHVIGRCTGGQKHMPGILLPINQAQDNVLENVSWVQKSGLSS